MTLAVADRRTFRCSRCGATCTEGVAAFRTAPTCTCDNRLKPLPMIPTTTEAKP